MEGLLNISGLPHMAMTHSSSPVTLLGMEVVLQHQASWTAGTLEAGLKSPYGGG